MHTLDLVAIRCAAERGETIMPATILALVERCETAEANMAYAFPALQRVDTERLALLDILSVAQAWRGALERCDGIAAAEQQLLAALRAYPSFITIAQAAERLGVSGRRVQQLIDDGRVTAEKVAKIWLLDPASVAAYAGSRKTGRPRKVRE